MPERIGVTYLPVMLGTYHIALWYENSAGEGRRAQSLYCAASRQEPTVDFEKTWPGGAMRFAYFARTVAKALNLRCRPCRWRPAGRICYW
jgi:hypothetical protein